MSRSKVQGQGHRSSKIAFLSTTRECVHLVRRDHFRSRDKDGGPPLPTRVLRCGNRDFTSMCSCDLDLDLMTFINEFNPYPLKLYSQTKNKLSTSSPSKVIVLTDDGTDATKNTTTLLRWW